MKPEDEQRLADHFDEEFQQGRMVGPFDVLDHNLFHFYRVSPAFLIPKTDDKWRCIHHMSYPAGASVNDGVDASDFPVDFVTLKEMQKTLAEVPVGVLMSKRDIKDAYKQVLVNPADWPLMVLRVQGHFLIPVTISMGGSGSPGIFDSISNLSTWIFANVAFPIPRTIRVASILDDFCIFHLRLRADMLDCEPVKLATSEAQHIDGIFADLGFPLKHSKSVTGVTELVFLGIGWNTVERACFVPADKADRYLERVQSVLSMEKHVLSLHGMRSLLGVLVYVSFLAPQSRTKLFWLFRVLKRGEAQLRRRLSRGEPVTQYKVMVVLDAEALTDLEWWQVVLRDPPLHRPLLFFDGPCADNTVVTDAAPSTGVGGYWKNQAFSFAFSEVGHLKHSTWAELFALAVAVALWGDH